MDQRKTGRLIAERRKAQNITQRQLADLLSVSDKTISKWECGKGLPEVSLMLPLCAALHITVNDLLTGEKVSEVDYQRYAEENLMNLVRENRENKKRMVLSIICGVITLIAVGALIVIAAYLALPAGVRIALIVFAAGTAAVGIGAAAVLDAGAGYYMCPHCGARFVPDMGEYVKGYHTFTKRSLTCPECKRKGMCRRRLIR